MTNSIGTLATLLLLLFLVGCGQSGPLFIPGNPSTVQASPSPQEPVEEDDEDSEESDYTGTP